MRSALLDVKGVRRAIVTLENHEAVVTYDPDETTVDQLIAAVNKVDSAFPYTATLKGAAR